MYPIVGVIFRTMGTSNGEIFNGLGFFGGVLLAFSLLPQIYLAHKRRSTSDISYIWQVSMTIS